MEPNYSIDDPLWECYKTFGKVVDDTPIEKLVEFLKKGQVAGVDSSDIAARIAAVRNDRKKLQKLIDIPLIAQRTPEWYELRKNRLTASDTAQSMGLGKFGTREQLVHKKATGESGGINMFSPPLKWGTMYEAMATRCYSQRHGDITIHEFGLIPHPSLACYGASPDGITELGVMIEIKCPYRRKITGEVPSYYELQMQGQLAVCELTECDFIECDMQEFSDCDDYFVAIADDKKVDHGVIAEFRNTAGTDIHYEYSDAYLNTKEAFRSMQIRAAQYLKANSDMHLIKLRPWSLRLISIRRVQFDQERWNTVIAPAVQLFWDAVIERRASPKEVSSNSKSPTKELDLRSNASTKKSVVDFIDDDD